MEYRQMLKSQIKDAYGRVIYTYTAHHKLADRLKKRIRVIKTMQIVLTSMSTVGFFAAVITNQVLLSWIGGITAALSLGLNLYTKDFDLLKEIKQHEDAANALWDVREKYISLLTDFDVCTNEEIRQVRNELQEEVSQINKQYPGTDTRSYRKAQKAIQIEEEQTFNEGEVDVLLPYELRNK